MGVKVVVKILLFMIYFFFLFPFSLFIKNSRNQKFQNKRSTWKKEIRSASSINYSSQK